MAFSQITQNRQQLLLHTYQTVVGFDHNSSLLCTVPSIAAAAVAVELVIGLQLLQNGDAVVLLTLD